MKGSRDDSVGECKARFRLEEIWFAPAKFYLRVLADILVHVTLTSNSTRHGILGPKQDVELPTCLDLPVNLDGSIGDCSLMSTYSISV